MESLDVLGRRFGSDKFTRHNFGPIYDKIFSTLREQAKAVLEIGIGGEGYDVGGQSLLTWKEYFPSAKIVGIDIFDKSQIQDERIITAICDQNNSCALTHVAKIHGPFDVIIDDGTHRADDAARSLQTLFHHLRPGGVYVIEDIQTSYWSQYGGSSITPDWYLTNIKWLKGAIDIINSTEMTNQTLNDSSGRLDIAELHVYHNLAAVIKSTGKNPESNVLDNEMRNNIFRDDLFYNNDLRGIYELYRLRPDQFRCFLKASAEVFNTLLRSSDGGDIFGIRNEMFNDDLKKCMQYFRFSNNQKIIDDNLIANLSDTCNQYRAYIEKIEEVRTQLASANNEYRKYISLIEEDKNRLTISNSEQKSYIEVIEGQNKKLNIIKTEYENRNNMLSGNKEEGK